MKHEVGDQTLAILAFHKIGEPPPGARSTIWYIPEILFRRHLEYLATHGWEVISLPRFLTGLSAPESLPQRAVVLTFDDGYKSILNIASPYLLDFGYPSVIFIPVGFTAAYNNWDTVVGEPREEICNWDDLRELERRGCSVQSHGVAHKAFLGLTLREQEQELSQSKTIIEAELGQPVEVFAYPYGLASCDTNPLTKLFKAIGYRAAVLFGGGICKYPLQNCFFLPRVAMFPDSDLRTLLGSSKP